LVDSATVYTLECSSNVRLVIRQRPHEGTAGCWGKWQ